MLIGFKEDYAPAILLGLKETTWRRREIKAAPKPGDRLHLYTSLRTKDCRMIGTATCTAVQEARISFGYGRSPSTDHVRLGKAEVTRDQTVLRRIAMMDGFASWLEMRRALLAMHPALDFAGVVIRWEHFLPAWTFIGQAPGKENGRAVPLCGGAGDRLAAYADLEPEVLWKTARAANLLRRYPGAAAGGGDRFPMARASGAARRLRIRTWGAIALGNNVARALGWSSVRQLCAPRLAAMPSGQLALAASMPHPSGVSRWWNDPGRRDAACGWLRDRLRGEWGW